MLRRDEKQAEVFGWVALGAGSVLLIFLSVWLWRAVVVGRELWGQ
jgi:hypothetical protein